MSLLPPNRHIDVQRMRTIAVVAFSACDGERARRPFVHTGAIDIATVDAVARLSLRATRCGLRMRIYDADPALADLLALVGLSTIVGDDQAM